jgi:AcrR family transcriptional regulator
MAEKLPARDKYRHGDLRRALIAAGMELARAGGPDAVVLREATRRAGVVPNAAYRHFASRDQLLEAVRSAALAELATAMETEISAALRAAPSASALECAQASLRAVGAGYVRFARQETGLFRTAFASSTAVGEADVDPERAGPGGLSAFHLLTKALDDLVHAGALPPTRRPGAEYLAWSAVHGLAMLTIDGPMARLPAAEIDALGARLLDVVTAGL